MKLAAIAFVGGLMAASLGANWWLWSSLQKEQQAHAEARADAWQCAATNAEDQIVIHGLNTSLDALVERRATERAEWAEASARRQGQIDRLQGRLEREADERERSYANCGDWADEPVCPAVSDRLRE